MGRHWTGAEIHAACKAYAKATLNPAVGADQPLEAFEAEMTVRMEEFTPADADDGTYHRRRKIYTYLRDNVFKCFQKFNKALRHIYACNPTGVTEQQKINMAVALHNKETQSMDYNFKDYDSEKKWKLYGGWTAVRHLPKFALNSGVRSPSSLSNTEEEESASSIVECVGTNMPARGVKRGRDAAKAAEKEAERVKRREEARDAQLKEMQTGLREISAAVKRRNSASIIVQALKVATDRTQKKELQAKLVAMALSL